MKKKNILFIMLGMLMLQGIAQNDKPERAAFTLKLAVDSTQFYEQEVLQTPYFVKEIVLQIYPSEKLFVEIEENKKGIVSMKSVKDNIHPEKTLIIECMQETKNRKPQSVILKIQNPFGKTLGYKAMMYIVGHKGWISTSVFPVQPKLLGYEMWVDTVITLVLSDWTLK